MGYGQQQSMNKDVYEVIVKKLKGEFNVPVNERTRVQQTALVRLWRNKDLYSLNEDGETLLCDRKPVVLKSKIGSIVKKGLDDTKGSDARKMNKRLNVQYKEPWTAPEATNSIRPDLEIYPFRGPLGPKKYRIGIRLTSLIWESGRSNMVVSPTDISSL